MRLSSCALFVALFALTASWSLATNPQSRDLGHYDNGGTFELRIFQDDPEAYAVKQDQIRAFLWVHWRSHRLGYMVIKRYPIDQPPNTTDYFVEPDAQGIWHVLMEIHRVEPDSKNPKRGRPVREELNIYELRRAQYKKDANDNWIFIPSDETRAPGSYVLVISDKSGKILGYQ